MNYLNYVSTLRPALPVSLGKVPLRRKVVLTVAALAILAALLIPLLGPLVDHHFAERQPGHMHLYLTGVPIHHLHHHEAFHSHDAPLTDDPGMDPAGPVLENSVIFMPQEGEGLAVSSIGVTLALLATVVALSLPTMLTLLTPRSQRAPRGITLYPEPPPPRLAR